VTEPERLLTGYRILDLTDELAVYGTRLLADWGAEVIKAKPPEGDPWRREPPFYADVPHPEHSLSFLAWNTNKKSITLNLPCADGRALFTTLLPSVDAIVVSAQPDDPLWGWLKDTELRHSHPGLVYTTASGFGQD
jgi:formyl-CoA transferase